MADKNYSTWPLDQIADYLEQHPCPTHGESLPRPAIMATCAHCRKTWERLCKPIKRRRNYALFERENRQAPWVRISEAAMPLPLASKHWQDALLAYILHGEGKERRLRPID